MVSIAITIERFWTSKYWILLELNIKLDRKTLIALFQIHVSQYVFRFSSNLNYLVMASTAS